MLLEHGGNALGPEPWGTARGSWERLVVAGLVAEAWEPATYRTPGGRNKKATRLDHYSITPAGRAFAEAARIHPDETRAALERMDRHPQRSGSLLRLRLRTRTREIRNADG